MIGEMLQGFGDAGTQCVDSGTDTDTGTNSRSMAWNCFFSSFSQHGGGHVVGAGVPARHAAFGVPPDKPWGGQALQVPEILKDSSGCVPHAQIIHHIVKKEKYECGQSEAEALPREPARQAGVLVGLPDTEAALAQPLDWRKYRERAQDGHRYRGAEERTRPEGESAGHRDQLLPTHLPPQGASSR